MNTNTITSVKWFWAWQDDREEAWLEEMSRNGLHLYQLSLPCVYKFNVGEKRDYAYRLDFITTSTKNEYLQLFADAGWEHLGTMGGWQYFRKARQEGDSPEIYSDNESKVVKYKRVFGFLLIFLPILFINFSNTMRMPAGSFQGVILGLYILLYGFFIYAIINLALRIRRLEKKL